MSEAASGWARGAKAVALVYAFALGGAAVAAVNPALTLLSPINQAAPPGSLHMAVVVLMLAGMYALGGAARRKSYRGEVAASPDAPIRPKLRRPAKRAGFAAVRWMLMLAAWLFIAYPVCWTWPTVGWKPLRLSLVGLAAGLVIYASFVAAMHWYLSLSGALPAFADENMRTLAGLWPRRRREKSAAWIAYCVLNPALEELLFRGVLVYQASLALESLWPPLLVGCAASLGNHWYQGRRLALFHFCFYWIAVGLLFSPLGLAGAIGFHIAGDVVPVSLMKRQLAAFRNRHRRAQCA